ncbi:cytochrome P450 [Xylariaceae sp. FL0804]|nr:cytochrome P450 [Xylariaceae sp. FL0804]
MAVLFAVLGAVLLLILAPILHTGVGIVRNYSTARRIGVPIRIILFDHNNPLWLVCDRWVLSLVRHLPFGLGNNSFTRYNYRGWEVPDRYYSHHEMGDAYILVSSSNIWLYIADPNTVVDVWRRGKQFPRDVSVTAILDVFGQNISTAQGAQWQKHRRITASSFDDHTNVIVWAESIKVARDVLHYWTSLSSVKTAADDLRTLSLLVMSRAGFGKSFRFQGGDERIKSTTTDASMSYKDSLKMILENCVLIFALGTKTLANPWLPAKLRRLHDACTSFQNYMTEVYEEEKRSLATGGSVDRNFMKSLVRASQEEMTTSTLGGLTENEIYGNMFTFNFAGHDTTAHTFTFALYFLAANPAVQDWIAEEIHHFLGVRQPEEWEYAEFPRLKRCLAVMYETLRLYTPVPTSKLVDGQDFQSLEIGDKILNLPPKTLIVPSYASLQTDPKHWGSDSLEWRPSRFIKSPHSDTTPSTVSSPDEEEFITPSRGTFLAWSGGPRDCIGRKFSQVEFVAVMASLFREWRVDPVLAPGDTAEDARKKVLTQIENDSAPVLLLQMLHPERCPLKWSRR